MPPATIPGKSELPLMAVCSINTIARAVMIGGFGSKGAMMENKTAEAPFFLRADAFGFLDRVGLAQSARDARDILVSRAARAILWQEFLANYSSVLDKAPHTFGAYCARFRERW